MQSITDIRPVKRMARAWAVSKYRQVEVYFCRSPSKFMLIILISGTWSPRTVTNAMPASNIEKNRRSNFNELPRFKWRRDQTVGV